MGQIYKIFYWLNKLFSTLTNNKRSKMYLKNLKVVLAASSNKKLPQTASAYKKNYKSNIDCTNME